MRSASRCARGVTAIRARARWRWVLPETDLEVCFRDKEHLTFEQFLHVIDGKTTGALRASIGLVTNFADVYRYVQFAETFLDQSIGRVSIA